MSTPAFECGLRSKWLFMQRFSTRMLLWVCVGAACWAGSARSREANEHDAKPTVLAPVVVTGMAPGPALWKVSKGDHVLWILGIAEPLPKRVKWRSEEVERIIAESQEVIGPVKGKGGLEVDLAQMFDVLRARKLSDGKRLVDVMPPDTYAKWLELKTQYAGRSDAIERRRPRFAAKELYEKAYDQLGLTLHDDVWRTVKRLARKYKVPIKVSRFTVVVNNSDDAIDQLNNAPIELDMPCFDRTLAALDHNARDVVVRAHTWAAGDMDVLRNAWISPQTACASVLTHMPGVADSATELAGRMNRDWADEATEALVKNRTSFGIQPMHALFQPDGVLTILRNRGYVVEEPM